MPLTAHLEELRWRIVRALLALGLAFGVCYYFAEALFVFLIRPLAALRPDQALVIGTGVTEAFFTKLKVSFIAALFAASPIIFFQAAVLTPGPDVASQLLMATPLLVLYWLSIGVAWLVAHPAPAVVAARSEGGPVHGA